MKGYKGFNKDMTCRGFQYEEGKTYETDTAMLCNSGFHACEDPLNCFDYYSPNSSVYHEVELEDVTDEKDGDTKRAGKKIKIGAALDVADICKAHFEYVKEHTTNSDQGKNYANLFAQDESSLSARNYSSLFAQNCSSLSAQGHSSLSARSCSSLSAHGRSSLSAHDWSSLSAQNGSSLSAWDGSSLSAQDESSLSAWDESSLSAQDRSSLSAHDYSSLSAQSCSSLSAQDRSSLSAQGGSSLSAHDWSSLSAQNESSLSARDWSSLSAQNDSSLSAGKNSVLAAFNSKAKAGIGSIIVLAKHDWRNNEFVVTDFAAAVVDGTKIKANTWYELKDGEFVEA